MDKFKLNGKNISDELQNPISQFVPIVKSDTEVITHVLRGVYVTGSGYAKIKLVDDTEPITIPVHEAQLLPFRVVQVYVTGTNAEMVGVI